MVGAIILAAGAGKRMGKPKAQLSHQGLSYLDRVVQTCHAGGCERIWVVARPDAPKCAALPATPTTVLVNPRPERGMFSSVLVGLASALESQAVGFLLFPVDHPYVDASTVQTMVSALSNETPWLCPQHSGRRGHPVAINRATAVALSHMDPGLPLRDALRSLSLNPIPISVDDPGVLTNVNYPKDTLPE